MAHFDSGSARLGLLWKPERRALGALQDRLQLPRHGRLPGRSGAVHQRPVQYHGQRGHEGVGPVRPRRIEDRLRFAGGTTLRSVTGYQDGNTAYRADLDGTSVGIHQVPRLGRRDALLAGVQPHLARHRPFKWIVGAFYQPTTTTSCPASSSSNSIAARRLPSMCSTAPTTRGTPPASARSASSCRRASRSAVGARYTDAHTTNHVNVIQYGAPIIADQSASFSDYVRQGRAELDDQRPELPLRLRGKRLQAGRSQRAGGLRLPAPFTEETVTSYEIGWKSRTARRASAHAAQRLLQRLQEFPGHRRLSGLSDVRLRAQRARTRPRSTASKRKSQAVFGDLSLDAGVGTANSSLGQFFATDPRVSRLDPMRSDDGPGERIVHQPGRTMSRPMRRTSRSTSAPQYDFAVGDGDTLTPRISYSHVSDAVGDAVRERGPWRPDRSAQHLERAARVDARQHRHDVVRHQPDRPALCRSHQLGPALRRSAAPVRHARDEDVLVPGSIGRRAAAPSRRPSLVVTCPRHAVLRPHHRQVPGPRRQVVGGPRDRHGRVGPCRRAASATRD